MTFLNLLPVSTTVLDGNCTTCKGKCEGCLGTCYGAMEGGKVEPEEPI